MRTMRIAAAAGVLLMLPVFGAVQQAPREVTDQEDGMERMRTLLSAQTTAIKTLRERIDELESRIERLEATRPDER